MLGELRERMRTQLRAEEVGAVGHLAALANLTEADRAAISDRAAALVRAVRSGGAPTMMESFLGEYGLSTSEGVALMCLAEAMLRVPDAETIDDLIQDKIVPHDWAAHVGDSGSLMVNASTWALMLTGQMLDDREGGVVATLRGMVRRLGEPVIRTAVTRTMQEMGNQFVLGRTINEAIKRADRMIAKGYRYSFDMLGEAALTADDADRYHASYANAIGRLAEHGRNSGMHDSTGISVKLSALHPRYEFAQRERAVPELAARTLELARAARDAGMGFNIDAEEADRLDTSLDVIERVLRDPSLEGWDGFGVVVQAYGPRAHAVIDWLHALATKLDRRIMVRLVKGAYWDTEIKKAQVMGLDGFPVFTRKTHTDISYLACARKLLDARDWIYPQFATHNAHTAAAVLHLAGEQRSGFEFQRLHGMGERLHDILKTESGVPCRIYAPVGAHSDLLAYLVRRLLENGANSSFVHQIVDPAIAPETIAADPMLGIADGITANPAIRRPEDLFRPARPNSVGIDLTDPLTVAEVEAGRAPFAPPFTWQAGSGTGGNRDVTNPARPDEVVGQVAEANAADAVAAIGKAVDAFPDWSATPVAERAAMLRRAADLYEEHMIEFMAVATREAGKSQLDGVAEVREAVDFLRYYADQSSVAEQEGTARGVIVCISPWNFPLAIFTGQVAAALVTGNAVIAKPAEQTPLIAARAVALLHQAGVPADALQLVCGDGPTVGQPLTADPRIAGVCFTGSTEVARMIEGQLAETAPDAMLIAETGGLNAMIVDSTALPEQAVRDIVASSFQSAGQRCSALRMLYVQEDVADRILEMLSGAMDALRVGDPWDLSTDVGPVIDEDAQSGIADYCAAQSRAGKLGKQLDVPDTGLFVQPSIVRVSGIEALEREVFGPILHVATFRAGDLGKVVQAINGRGYGLTFGVHTRIDRRVQQLVDSIAVGNVYVNRNQIGAIVGSQPFGGEGLSGTGPKAGGPHYLSRFRKQEAEAGVAAGQPSLDQAQVTAALRKLQKLKAGGRGDEVLAALRTALRGRARQAMTAAAALDMGPVDLPGPTGEANYLWLHPRGTVLCLGPDADTALDQAVQALRAGNRVLAIAPDVSARIRPLAQAGLPVVALDGTVAPEFLSDMEIDGVACAPGDPAYRKAMARRQGALMPLIDSRICPQAYAHERAICVDTTAAGGNADLLASA
ncbi:MAG: bifunctional protein PutA [Minwuia thermotolerans]|nr:MAG: bifunctional protein PutA [Minwuia thermotolerans]